MSRRSDLFWLDVLIVIYLLVICAALSGCAGGPSRTRPDGTYPREGRTYRPGLRVIPWSQLRCLGGGIGGCTLGGKVEK